MSAQRTLLSSLRQHCHPQPRPVLPRVAGRAPAFSTQPPPALTPPPPGAQPAAAAAPPSSTGGWRAADYAKDPIAWAVLLGLAGVAGFGAYSYEFYELYKTWPEAIRKPLKQAQKALDGGNFVRAERYFTEAYNLSRPHAPALPLLHTTGLASILAHVQADLQFAPQRAIPVLQSALVDLDARGQALTGDERLRRLGVLNKLAELAARTGSGADEEKYAVRAVTEVLRASAEKRRSLGARPPQTQVIKGATKAAAEGGATPSPPPPGNGDPDLDDLLPDWLGKTQVGATVDRLAGLYLKQGRADYAAPLYLHAINAVLPPAESPDDPSAGSASVEEQCRAAMMMANLSSTLSLKPTSSNLAAAHTWASKSLATIERVLVSDPDFSIGASRAGGGGAAGPSWLGRWWMKEKDSAKELAEQGVETTGRKEMCESVRSVALFNLGVLAEMSGDKRKAHEHLKESHKWSAEVGFVEGVKEASGALERMDAGGSHATPGQ